jgi:hypothetical protein
MADMRALEGAMKKMAERDRRPPVDPALDKLLRERTAQARKIDPQDLAKYSEFLKTKGSGIFRIFPDLGCVTRTLIKIDGECENFVPDSSDFSFRSGLFVESHYHDIGFTPEGFYSNGFFSIGMLTDLGDIQIGSLTIESPELKFLKNIQTSTSAADTRDLAKQVDRGIDTGQSRLAMRIKVELDRTYAIRSIAYRFGGSVAPPSEKSTMLDLRFLSLANDERKDVVVIFRVVRQEPAGGLTILWRELQRKDSPKIKFAKGEDRYDINPFSGIS